MGASIEFTFLGPTHNCPADISILKQIPNFEITVPGTSDEFQLLFDSCATNKNPTYYRLSRDENSISQKVTFGEALVLKSGSLATIIARTDAEYCPRMFKEYDVTILYYTTISPFDYAALKQNANPNIVVIEPTYAGSIADDIQISLIDEEPYRVLNIGLPKIFFQNYGLSSDYYKEYGITSNGIRTKFEEFIK